MSESWRWYREHRPTARSWRVVGGDSLAGGASALWHASRTERVAKGYGTMHLIWILLIGLVVGAIAKLVMPGRDPGGAIITILLGIAGSFIADYLGRAAGWYGPNQSAGLVASVLGAVILLAGYRLIVGRGRIAG